MDNLNPFLQPNNAPVTNPNGNSVNAFDFGQNYQRDSVTPTKISYLPVSKITAGTILVQFNIGSSSNGYMLLDGANNRILINDGTTNRIAIGAI